MPELFQFSHTTYVIFVSSILDIGLLKTFFYDAQQRKYALAYSGIDIYGTTLCHSLSRWYIQSVSDKEVSFIGVTIWAESSQLRAQYFNILYHIPPV